MKFSTILNLCCGLVVFFFATTLNAQQKGLEDVAPNFEAPAQVAAVAEDLHDLQFAFGAQSLMTGATWLPVDTSYWVTYWQNDSIYRYDVDGNYIERFQIPVSGSRSITFDGTNVWFGNATTTISAVNPTTRALVTTVTVPEAARYLTYDPDANMGAGGFWLGNWNTDVYQVDMAGTTLSTIPTANLPASRYGAVYDNISPNGPHVWFFHQSSTTTSAEAVQYHIGSGTTTATLDFNAIVGTVNTTLAGGMFITDQVSATPTLGGVLQNVGVVGVNLLDTTEVTFRVDMKPYTGSFTTVYVSGDFEGWTAGIPMSDNDGDGIWELTVGMPSNVDSIEWKFQLDQWTDQEQFAGGESCTKTTGAFTNRFADVTNNTDLGTVCWNQCEHCVGLTFEINTAYITATGGTVDPAGIYLAGGSGFGVPGDNPADDSDGDGIWTVTVFRPVGFSSYYTFLNGNCGDWSCKENIAGLSCSHPANFDDRLLPPTFSDTTILACFGTCDSDGNCYVSTDVTFNINMESAPQNVQDSLGTSGTVYVSGNFNNWAATDNPMTDNGDGTWTATIPIGVPIGGSYDLEWKHQVNGWQVDEILTDGDSCTLTTGSFTNRYAQISSSYTTPVYCWAVCTECLSNTNGLVQNKDLFKLNPSLVRDFTNITFNADVVNQDKQVFVYNAVGELVANTTVNNQNIYRLETANFANGLYFVTVKTETSMLTQKFVVSK